MLKRFVCAAMSAFALLAFVTAAEATEYGMVMPPQEFIRVTAAPESTSVSLSTTGFQPPYKLYLRNGDENGQRRVSAAEVLLNGVLVFGPQHFSQAVYQRSVDVSLSEPSILVVRLASAPGSKLTIWIEGVRAGQPFALDQGLAQTKVFDAAGGKLTATGSNGAVVELTLPPGALLEPAEIKLTPIRSLGPLPLGGGFKGGVDISAPEGTHLWKAARIVITLPSLIPGSEGVFGFRYDSVGSPIRLAPVKRENLSFTFETARFSGYGVSAGTETEVQSLASDPSLTPMESASAQVALLLEKASQAQLEGNEDLANEYLAQAAQLWAGLWESDVRPYLIAARQLCQDKEQCLAGSLDDLWYGPARYFLNWGAISLQLGNYLPWNDFTSLWWYQFANLAYAYNAQCVEVAKIDPCVGAVSYYETSLTLNADAQALGIDTGQWGNPKTMCHRLWYVLNEPAPPAFAPYDMQVDGSTYTTTFFVSTPGITLGWEVFMDGVLFDTPEILTQPGYFLGVSLYQRECGTPPKTFHAVALGCQDKRSAPSPMVSDHATPACGSN